MGDMTCDDCTRAKAGLWGGYRRSCHGCTARAIARSQATHQAIRENDPAELRAMIGRLLPEMPYAEARELVWEWWQQDHPTNEARA